MKKMIFTVIAAAISYNIALPQPCLPEGITFSTQEEIDNFQTNYPGCTEIEGDVTIQGIEICSLYGLNVLTSIGGDLKIICIEVNDLFGLDSLISIGGDLVIEGNLGLYDLEGLEALHFIGGDLSIGVNFVLESLSGLMSLSSIEGDFWIYNNDFLYSLWGLQNLTTVGGNLTIYDNEQLYGLICLDSLTSIVGGLSIGNNNFLSNLSGLNALNTIGGGIGIYSNNNLSSLTGLESISFIGGTLDISSNNNLVNLSGMDNLCSIAGELSINYNNALIDLSGLENIISVGSDLSIYNNTSLKSLIGLEGLTSIGEDIEIVNNDSLTNITGLENINASSITNLSVYGNPVLTACEVQSICDYLASPNGVISIHDNAPGCNSQQEVEEACEALTHCLPEGITFTTQQQIDNFQTNYPGCTVIEGDVNIKGEDITDLNGLIILNSIEGNFHIGGFWSLSNNSLTNLQGLNNLTTIGGSLEINYNIALLTTAGLDNLLSVGSDLSIHSNNNLANLIGLNGLSMVGGGISICYNGELSSLEGLENINSASISNLAICENNQLSECAIENICNYLIDPNGTVIIYNNTYGCQSPQEIAGNCGITLPCLPYGNYYFYSQEDINNFQINYPNCNDLEGDVTIHGYYLYNLMGLNNVTSVAGSLYIQGGYINNLMGLSNLTSIGGNLTIRGNPCLISFTGLSSLSEIGGFLRIDLNQNSLLTSLSGLDNITEESITDLTIVANYSVSECDIQNICAYLINPNGTVEIHDNATGCNSPEEVEAACLNTMEEIKTSNGITMVPNPSNDKITVSSPAITANTQLSIFNVNGEKVIERQLNDNETQLDISALPRGVYFVRVQDETVVEVGKIVKE
jgi:hypothetical protein